MTKKAEFNAEEWEQDQRGPGPRRADVIAAERGGTIRESLAMATVYPEAREKHASATSRELVEIRAHPRREAVREQGGHRSEGLERMRDAVGAARGEGDAGGARRLPDVRDDRRPDAAEADKSGGFLGIGGERISGNEESALNEIADALGTEAPPPPPSSRRAHRCAPGGGSVVVGGRRRPRETRGSSRPARAGDANGALITIVPVGAGRTYAEVDPARATDAAGCTHPVGAVHHAALADQAPEAPGARAHQAGGECVAGVDHLAGMSVR